MDSQSYYRIDDSDGCNNSSAAHHLIVNCAGVSALNRPFNTWRPQGRQDYYLMYVYRGALTFRLRDQDEPSPAGRFILFRPGCATGYSKLDQAEMIYYWAHFTGAGVTEILNDCHLSDQTLYEAGINQLVIGLFHELFDQFIYRDAYFQPATATLLQQILLGLRRAVEARQQGRADQERLGCSLAFIHKQYSRSLTIRELADIEHLSVSRYSALFRDCMGQSPQSYIIEMRLRMAAELLQRTDLSIKQVACTVGYEDQLYFSRLFRSRRGVPPSLYQQQHQAGGRDVQNKT